MLLNMEGTQVNTDYSQDQKFQLLQARQTKLSKQIAGHLASYFWDALWWYIYLDGHKRLP